MKRILSFLFLLALSTAASAAPKPFMLESKTVTHTSGVVSTIGKSELCMDGATYSMHTQTDNLRLKARNDAIAHQLDHAAKSGKPVAITGHNVLGPECSYLHVDSVSPLKGARRRTHK